jgi:DNA invertase Pin-like site-specific DNA recombinase
MISARTKAPLEAAKSRGVKLGGPRTSTVREGQKAIQKARRRRAADTMRRRSGSCRRPALRAIAATLNDRGIPTPSGRGTWQAVQVRGFSPASPEARRARATRRLA